MMHDPSERAGARLREMRKRLGLSRREVSRRTGVGVLALAGYERGRRIPESVLAGLARTYGIAPGEVVPSRSRSRLEVQDGELVAGPASRPLPDDADEVEVLNEYLDLVRELRGLGPDDELPIRDADLPALAEALGDRPEQIEDRLVALIACTREEARAIRRALVTRRLVAPAAGLVIGVGGLTPALAQSDAEEPRSSTVSPAAAASTDPSPSSGSSGSSEESEGTGHSRDTEAPPTTTTPPTTPTTAPSDASPVPVPDPGPSAPDPAPGHPDEGDDPGRDHGSDEPSGEDWAEIGEAVVIERDRG